MKEIHNIYTVVLYKDNKEVGCEVIYEASTKTNSFQEKIQLCIKGYNADRANIHYLDKKTSKFSLLKTILTKEWLQI
ncbi:TPA: hypothetical protein ACR3Z0_006160 [Bacillus thuringiensis]|uniref:Uncharacterized protein n=2 Tax=Bacillus cereus group TaxID=86661 RepID=A0A9X0GC86_BACCE|nr:MULTISPECIES: hypothetical protein [Bacillus]ACI30634.1 hypothetical protein BCH308197_B0037 [Bacillus cereus H3081.97]AJA23552.1 hypothetical protein BT4G5_32670 [Bacillus thuringiensis serovar galleriae]AJQ62691.1 hypothetical protein SD98_31075 [Bacillus thuringiensis serovar morrisoni]EJQ96322.1 hypothetical protein II5_06102 [Bacillus cereus MSX-A1]ETE93784.1 hypothetical protein C623_0224920 [Bacillus thuringiensis serovar aizawai str. Hu4-2]